MEELTATSADELRFHDEASILVEQSGPT